MEFENLDPSVTDVTYDNSIVYDIKTEVIGAFQDFYISHVEGSLRIFHTLTVGEMVIAVLLGLAIILFVFKWIWEVIHYG